MTDTDFADDLALLANNPAQIESLLHSMEQAVKGGIGFNMNATKTEFMCFKQKGATFTLSRWHLKFVDQFTCFCSNELKVMSTYAEEKHGQLLTSYQPYESLISLIKKWDFF